MRIAQCVRTTALWRTIPVCAGMRKERLTMREKLIELIRHYTSCEECLDADIADHLLANGVTVGETVTKCQQLKWIPVTERLPEKGTTHCKDCENLMFSDCYGECGAAHKSIVRPDDTCEYAVKRKPKEGE